MSTELYNTIHRISVAVGEGRKDCWVQALATVTNLQYVHTLRAFDQAGRRRNSGTNYWVAAKAAELLGFRLGERLFIYRAGGRVNRRWTGRTIEANGLTRRGSWIVHFRGHVGGIKDGVLHDWSREKLRRVDWICRVITQTEGDSEMTTSYLINVDKNRVLGRFDSVDSAEKFAASVNAETHLFGNQKGLEKYSGPELAELYNSMVEKEKQVKKFASKEVAQERVWAQLQTFEAKPTSTRKRAAPTVKANGFNGKKIFILTEKKENPRREGSHGFNHFELYKDGMAYEKFVEARMESKIPGALNQHLNWDVKSGFIELR